MNQFISILILVLYLICATITGPVKCPQAQIFKNCLQCYQYTQLSDITCSCYNYQFNIIEKCFKPSYPCSSSFLSYLYDPKYEQFNIWKTQIAIFWSNIFANKRIDGLSSSAFRQIANGFNFQEMNDTQMKGWIQAYYLYLAFQAEINDLFGSNSQAKFQLAQESLQFVQSVLGYDSQNKWYQLTNFVNRRLKKNMTLVQFYNLVKERVKQIIPCHNCSSLYGIITVGRGSRCSNCPNNCLSCQNNTKTCTQCINGFVAQGGKCVMCSTIGGCMVCQRQSVCWKCWPGQGAPSSSSPYSRPNRCNDCIQQCATCVDDIVSVCTTCNDMIFNFITGSHGRCWTCNEVQCRNCDLRNLSKCFDCYDGYYLKGDACQLCQPYCLKCTQKGCKECQLGYGLVQGECLSCHAAGCLSCNNNRNFCSACMDPFFQINSQSLSCQLTNMTQGLKQIWKQQQHCRPGCEYCYSNDTSKCLNCAERYRLVDGQCKKCEPGCLICTQRGACRRCTSGYAHRDQRECVKCLQNCRRCYIRPSLTCTDCMHGYILINGTCSLSTTPECIFLNTQINRTEYSSQCHLCLPGYTLNEQKKCIKCQMSCNQTCKATNISECRRSKLMFAKIFDFKHSYKSVGCKAQINGHCVLPEKGYKLTLQDKVITVERKCLYPCKTCEKDHYKCKSCQKGYILQNEKCVFNQSCNPNCISCPAGTERNQITSICVKCLIEDCATCKLGKCFQCHEGYYINYNQSNQKCLVCPERCRKCYDQDNCKDCADGYFWPLEYSQNYRPYDCKKCNENCLTCKYWPSFCLTCTPGTRNINFQCIKQFYVSYRYILDANYSEFIQKVESQRFIQSVMKMLFINKTDIFISIKNGSVIISGLIASINQATALSYYNSMRNRNLPDFNYTVLGKSFSLMNDTQVVQCEAFGKDVCLGSSKGLGIGAIVGIVIGSIALALILAFIVYRVIKWRKDKSLLSDEKIQYDNKAATQNPDSDNNFRSLKSQKYQTQSDRRA